MSSTQGYKFTSNQNSEQHDTDKSKNPHTGLGDAHKQVGEQVNVPSNKHEEQQKQQQQPRTLG